VGYGDITPTNDRERMFSTFSLVVGALSFAFINGNVVSVLASLDNHASLVEGKMEAVKEYVQWRSLPKDLVTRVRRYYEHYYDRTAVFDESDILKGLNPNLRVEVVDYILNESLGRLPLFGMLNPDFKLDLFPKLKPISFAPGEEIYRKGAKARALYFLLSGEIDVYRGTQVPGAIAPSRLTPDKEQELSVDWTGEIGPTTRFSPDGEILLTSDAKRAVAPPMAHEGIFGQAALLGRRREATLVARNNCEALLIAREDIQRLFDNDGPSARRVCVLVLDAFLRMDRLSMLALRLRVLAHSHHKDHKKGLEEWCALTIQYHWRRYSDLLARVTDPIYELMEREGLPQQEGTDTIAAYSNRSSRSDTKRKPSMLDLRRQSSSSSRLSFSAPFGAATSRGWRDGAHSHRGGGGDRAVMRKLGEIMGALSDVKARVERLETPVSSSRSKSKVSGALLSS